MGDRTGPRLCALILAACSWQTQSAAGLPQDTGKNPPGKFKAARAEYSYVYLSVPPLVPDPTVTQSYGECEPTTADAAPDSR
jgi:hypothetical protein